MLEGSNSVLLQNKARKREHLEGPVTPCLVWPTVSADPCSCCLLVSIHLSESITGVLNDSSLVFYRMNEHIHKKVPQFVEEKVRQIDKYPLINTSILP
jgi:hypothetical protein